MEYTIQTFISFLKANKIPYEIMEDSSLKIREDDLIPFEAELRKRFPSFPIPEDYTDQGEASGKKKKK